MNRRQLIKNVSKNFKTCMIGGLDSFEQNFGHLWGHGKSESELTENELAWRDVWDETRTEILDKGNHQARLAETQISSFGISQTHVNKFYQEG